MELDRLGEQAALAAEPQGHGSGRRAARRVRRGLEELEAAVVAEETAAETATETIVVEQTPTTETMTQSSVLSWLDSLFQ